MKLRSLVVAGVIMATLCAGFFAVHTVQQVQASEISHAQAEEDKLRERLAELEKEIKEQEKLLQQQKGQSSSIQSVINTLKSEINKTRSEIEKKELLIKQLSGQINQKQETIQSLSTELSREQSSLAKLIRKVNEIESLSLMEMFLSSESVSEFYRDVDSFLTIEEALYDSTNVIKQVRTQTDEEKIQLEEKKAKEADIKYALEQDKKKVESKKTEQNTLLTISKGKEQGYQQLIAQQQAQAAEIRARLFELAGGLPSGGISFGDALKYANEASGKTGVRPAFILAILQQESNMGKNVGTCNRPGDSRTWRDIMPGPYSGSWRDDQTAYLQIMNELGLPPDGQPLSCPISSGTWGGAMGPTQFIPTTWLGIRDALANMLGVSATNPWNPRHAVHATAIYVRDLGAAKGGFTAEREAACKYYSGRGCFAPNVKNMFYGNAVMSHAERIQKDIDFLENN